MRWRRRLQLVRRRRRRRRQRRRQQMQQPMRQRLGKRRLWRSGKLGERARRASGRQCQPLTPPWSAMVMAYHYRPCLTPQVQWHQPHRRARRTPRLPSPPMLPTPHRLARHRPGPTTPSHPHQARALCATAALARGVAFRVAWADSTSSWASSYLSSSLLLPRRTWVPGTMRGWPWRDPPPMWSMRRRHRCTRCHHQRRCHHHHRHHHRCHHHHRHHHLHRRHRHRHRHPSRPRLCCSPPPPL